MKNKINKFTILTLALPLSFIACSAKPADQSAILNEKDPVAIEASKLEQINSKTNLQLSELEKQYSNFAVSEISEDPFLDGFLKDVGHSVRDFYSLDNGLFKIKIEKELITKKVIWNLDDAKLLAQYVISQINIGPAILNLEKGIQFLVSNEEASLGGDLGVQIALPLDGKTYTHVGLEQLSSLVAHEYGHHESLWDFHNIVQKKTNDQLAETISKILIDNHYDAELTKYLKSQIFVFDPTRINHEDLPSDYLIPGDQASQIDWKNKVVDSSWIYNNPNYPLNAVEIITRLMNVLRFKLNSDPFASLSKINLENNKQSEYLTPTFLTSDFIFRHFSHDSIFKNGKDNSRIEGLYQDVLKQIFGYGTILIEPLINVNQFQGLRFHNFSNRDIAKIQLVDQNQHIQKEWNLEIKEGLFGHKNELISNQLDFEKIYNFSQVDEMTSKVDPIDLNKGENYQLIFLDKNDQIVQLNEQNSNLIGNSYLENAQTKIQSWGADIDHPVNLAKLLDGKINLVSRESLPK